MADDAGLKQIGLQAGRYSEDLQQIFRPSDLRNANSVMTTTTAFYHQSTNYGASENQAQPALSRQD